MSRFVWDDNVRRLESMKDISTFAKGTLSLIYILNAEREVYSAMPLAGGQDKLSRSPSSLPQHGHHFILS